MSVTDHEKIRLRAFQIWESEGRPEGLDQEHWQRAECEPSLMPAPKVAKPSSTEGAATKKAVAAKKPALAKTAPKAVSPKRGKPAAKV